REAARPVAVVVNDLFFGRFEAKVRTIAASAAIVCELWAMPAKAELVVRLVEAAVTSREIELPVLEFKSGSGDDVHHSVRAIAVFCRVSSAGDLNALNVLRIQLPADVTG